MIKLIKGIENQIPVVVTSLIDYAGFSAILELKDGYKEIPDLRKNPSVTFSPSEVDVMEGEVVGALNVYNKDGELHMRSLVPFTTVDSERDAAGSQKIFITLVSLIKYEGSRRDSGGGSDDPDLVRHSEFSGLSELSEPYTEADMKNLLDDVVNLLKGTVTAVALASSLVLPGFCQQVSGEYLDVQTARKDAIYNDAQIVTNVTVGQALIDAIENAHGDPVSDENGNWMIPYGKSGDLQIYRKVTASESFGNTMTVGSDDYILTNGVFIIKTAPSAFEYTLGGLSPVSSANWSPSGTYATSSQIQVYCMQVIQGGSLCFGDWTRGNPFIYGPDGDVNDISKYVHVMTGPGEASFHSSFVSSDGRYLFRSIESRFFRYTLSEAFDISAVVGGSSVTYNPTTAPYAMAVSTDGTRFFYKGKTSSTLYVRDVTNAWDFAALDHEEQINLNSTIASGITFGSFTFSSDGRYAIFCGFSGSVGYLFRVRMSNPWDVSTAIVLEQAKMFNDGGYIFGVAVNEADDVLFLYKSGSSDGTGSGKFYSYQLGDKVTPSPFATQRYVADSVSNEVSTVTAVIPSSASATNMLVASDELNDYATTNWVINVIKPTRIYNAAGTDALDDKGQLFTSQFFRGGYWEGTWYQGGTLSGRLYYIGVDQTAHTWVYYVDGTLKTWIRLYSNGNIIVNNESAVTPSPVQSNIDPTDSESGRLMAGEYTWGTKGTFRYIPQSVQMLSDPYAHFALESVPDRVYTNTLYAVGDLVSYSNKAYRCTTKISTAEEWTPAHWTEIPTLDSISPEFNPFAGELYDFSSNSNLVRAVEDIIRALGGSVTNSPVAGH